MPPTRPLAERFWSKRSRRSRPTDRLPQPHAVAREVHEVKLRLSVLAAVYLVEHDSLASLGGGSDVHVTSGPSDTTVSSLMDRENEAARDRCREAVAFLRRASANVDEALKAFGPDAVQPIEPSRDSVVNYSTFNRAVNRAEHYDRERQTRSS